MRSLGQDAEALFGEFRIGHSDELLFNFTLGRQVTKSADGIVLRSVLASIVECLEIRKPSSTRNKAVPEKSFMKLLLRIQAAHDSNARDDTLYRTLLQNAFQNYDCTVSNESAGGRGTLKSYDWISHSSVH